MKICTNIASNLRFEIKLIEFCKQYKLDLHYFTAQPHISPKMTDNITTETAPKETEVTATEITDSSNLLKILLLEVALSKLKEDNGDKDSALEGLEKNVQSLKACLDECKSVKDPDPIDLCILIGSKTLQEAHEHLEKGLTSIKDAHGYCNQTIEKCLTIKKLIAQQNQEQLQQQLNLHIHKKMRQRDRLASLMKDSEAFIEDFKTFAASLSIEP